MLLAQNTTGKPVTDRQSTPEKSPASCSGRWENENLSQIPYKVYRGHRSGVTCCRFCHNDTLILSSSKDGNTQLWNIAKNQVVHVYGSHTLPVTKSQISMDETQILSASWDKTLCLFDTETGDVLWRRDHDGIVMWCDLSSDGNYAVSCCDYDNSVKIWDLRDGKVIHNLIDFHASTPTCCIFSPNSQRIATTGMDRVTKVWDLVSKKTTVTLTGHKNIVSNCCFSKNERYLATAAWDKTLQVWDISTGMFRSQGASVLEKGHDGSVSCCQFSSGAKHIVSGDYDCAVVVWEVENKSKKIVLKGHDGWVNGVDVCKSGDWILSCSDDATIRLWDIHGADQIPAVLENRKSMGLKIVQCKICTKPFSISQVESPEDYDKCVFCRLGEPERNWLPQL